MIIPYIAENLLEINKTLYPQFENNVIIVDNFYKNYEMLHEILQNTSVSRWKWDPNGRNFIDYYDCRPTLSCPWIDYQQIKISKVINQLLINFYFIKEPFVQENGYLEFNFYKNIKTNVSNNLQHHPHIDDSFNCLVYMDKISSGGTAIYQASTDICNDEQINLLYDISNLKYHVIQSVPNRLVIFPGWLYHGGYIEDHNAYVHDWRINHIMFFKRHLQT